ncbi:hypothetical protein F3D3_0477 [Fusibacter sp. 3D3]|nr:hypothetical protein F3D3_0477 [Fusibacter sp. 3D3]
MILTPGAKDVLRNLGVTIKFGSKPCKENEKAQAPTSTCDIQKGERAAESGEVEHIKSQVLNMLQNDYGIKDTRVMAKILKGVLEKL